MKIVSKSKQETKIKILWISVCTGIPYGCQTYDNSDTWEKVKKLLTEQLQGLTKTTR